ncbi:ciliary microtubule inner protein 5 [Parambassis ranga]|uniref:Ciliary microtubule inner protein 5 n=1 Tax=Parambassis ranga TaxID=210632 RepID=A0A6P7HJT8_9TELE|nr:uncharacterized protein C2orf50 homolog [Parambassis ranga]
MDFNNVKRASSAGYRLPERSNGIRPTTTTPPPPDRARYAGGETQTSHWKDPVKRDQVWKDLIWNERRVAREWEKNWSFLRNIDLTGRLRPEQPLPSNLSLFSDKVPNTSNQIYGTQQSTPLGREVSRRDRLTVGHNKRKGDPEMLPC